MTVLSTFGFGVFFLNFFDFNGLAYVTMCTLNPIGFCCIPSPFWQKPLIIPNGSKYQELQVEKFLRYN